MRILVISPHADDEVFGCGGMIRRRVSEGYVVDVIVATISTVHRQSEMKATAETRTRELQEASKRLGVETPKVLFKGYENQLDTLPLLELVSALDHILDQERYDQVFIPYPSHHQDHRILYEAGFSALREKGTEHYPSLIAMYEYPYIGWTPSDFHGGKYYVNITEQLEEKLFALQAYESQLCPPPHPVSLAAVKTLAAMRGMECGRKYAELFYVIKMVD